VELRGAARPVSYYTDKASLFQTAPKISRDSKALPVEEREPLPPTQIGRALRELDIVWIGAHSPQAKGRVERSFQTAQDRLVKGLRVAGAKTLKNFQLTGPDKAALSVLDDLSPTPYAKPIRSAGPKRPGRLRVYFI